MRLQVWNFFRVGFWQNGFFADFFFLAAGFFRGFSRRIFSPHFCGKKCPEKSSRKIPEKILQNLYNKNPPTHFCRVAGANFYATRLHYLLRRWHGKHGLAVFHRTYATTQRGLSWKGSRSGFIQIWSNLVRVSFGSAEEAISSIRHCPTGSLFIGSFRNWMRKRSPSKCCRLPVSAALCFSEDAKGGEEKRGGWKTSRMTPLPNPPSYGTFSTPLRCHCPVFPGQKSTTELTWRGPKIFGRVRFLVHVAPPIRFSAGT